MDKKIKIIHIEDLQSDADLVERTLKKGKLDFEIVVVDNENKFIQALHNFSPDIILSDHSLPSFNSHEALAILRNSGKDIPFILVTANTSEDFAVEVIRRGAEDYILKDRLERLPNAIENALEKKQLEKERQGFLDEIIKNEKHYRALIENMHDAIILVNEDAQLIYQSPSVKHITGFGVEELRGKKIFEFIHKDHLPECITLFQQVCQGPQAVPVAWKHQVLVKNDQYIWTEGTFTNLLQDKNVKAVIVNYREITKRKLAEESLKQSEARYRSIVETAQEGIWLIDENANTTFVNKKMADILEYSQQEMLGKEMYYFMDDTGKKVAETLMKRRKEGVVVSSDIGYITKNGKQIWATISVNPFSDDNGNLLGALAMVSDITVRKKAEERNRFKAHLLNTIGQAAVGTDLDGLINYWNKAAEKIYGWTEEEAIGNNIINLLASNQTREHGIRIVEGLMQGIAWSDEFKVQQKDGAEFIAFMTGSPTYNLQNEITGAIVISSDVTERKKLEDLLEKSNRMARIGNWEVNLLTNTVYWSDITRQIHEVDSDYIPALETGMDFYKAGVNRDAITKAVQQAIEKGIAWDMELEIITAKGHDCWVRSIGRAEFVKGVCTKLYGSFQDINTRKCAEIEVLKAYDERNTILESIGDAFFAVDKNWVVTYWNTQAEKLTGISRNKVMELSLWTVFPHITDSVSYQKYHEVIKTGQVVRFEDYHAPTNSWYEVSAYPSGNGLSVYFNDITPRKQIEIKLTELNENLYRQTGELAISNTELEQFAFAVSHDLQEPLRMVIGFLRQLEKKYQEIIDDTGKKYIYYASDGAKRMNQIILDLLEFSRIGHTDDTLEEVDLSELVDDICLLLRKQIDAKKAIIKISSLPVLKTYPTPMRQIFQNLVSNGLKYSREGVVPEITISCKDAESFWRFEVADNGIGINAQYLDTIFIIFRRLHTRDEYPGTGIGLAITKKIIEQMGGKIWVESEESCPSARMSNRSNGDARMTNQSDGPARINNRSDGNALLGRGKGSTFYFTIPKTNTAIARG